MGMETKIPNIKSLNFSIILQVLTRAIRKEKIGTQLISNEIKLRRVSIYN